MVVDKGINQVPSSPPAINPTPARDLLFTEVTLYHKVNLVKSDAIQLGGLGTQVSYPFFCRDLN